MKDVRKGKKEGGRGDESREETRQIRKTNLDGHLRSDDDTRRN